MAKVKFFSQVLLLISAISFSNQQTSGGVLQQSIYQFLKSNQQTTRFAEFLDRTAQQSNDFSVVNALSSDQYNSSGYSAGFTAFVPVNEVINQIPSQFDQLRNEINNFIVKERLTLDRLRELNGQNLTRTFGYLPRLTLRVTRNFYSKQSQYSNRIQTNNAPSVYPANQPIAPNRKFPRQVIQNLATTPYPSSSNYFQNQPFNNSMHSDLSAYDQYANIYGGANQQSNTGPNISPKLPQDELFLLNNAIILDKFDLTNGIVYLINAYPNYYDKSIYLLLKENTVNGLYQNLNFWINNADQAFRYGNENLKNALNAFGPNTYFLPTDTAFNKFSDRDKLGNSSFLFDVLLKSHRISDRILFDYYLDDPLMTYYTDNRQPVSTSHRRINGIEEIEISIGHVKGRILPEFRNIYCASGVVHLIDTVLGVPSRTAYQEISIVPQLSTFKALIDRSSKYRQLLDQAPTQNIYPNQQPYQQRKQRDLSRVIRSKRQNLQNQTNNYNMGSYTNQQSQIYNNPSDIRFLTILAPSDPALLLIKDELFRNDSALDELLSTHIILDNSYNRVFYTDHDDSLFQNNQAYITMNPAAVLVALVQPDSNGIANNVVFQLQNRPSVKSMITTGNNRVNNGVIHIVDAPLILTNNTDITSLLDKYSMSNSPGTPAFGQFVDALRSTGIFNDLQQPSKKYTLFIPTDEALNRYQDIFSGNDLNKKKQLIYRHICLDQNLRSSNLLEANQQYNQNNLINNNNQNGLICRNALGQDLTLTKDSYGLVSKWQGQASSKILNDFPGMFASAYLIERPLLNPNVPNLGLNNFNSAIKVSFNVLIYLFCLILVKLTNY